MCSLLLRLSEAASAEPASKTTKAPVKVADLGPVEFDVGLPLNWSRPSQASLSLMLSGHLSAFLSKAQG